MAGSDLELSWIDEHMRLKEDRQKPPSWLRKYAVEVAIILVGFAAMNGIFLAKAFRESNTVDTESAGRLGDFVGGYVGALFALTGVVLLYVTLKAQHRLRRSSNEPSNWKVLRISTLN